MGNPFKTTSYGVPNGEFRIMNTTFYAYDHLSEELSELLEAFELKLNRSKERLEKAQMFHDADKVQALRTQILQWNRELFSEDFHTVSK